MRDAGTGSAPDVRWARSPHDERHHALRPDQADGAAAHGYADALCGLTLPAGVDFEAAAEPVEPLCWPCAVAYASELPDPGRFGTSGMGGM